MTAKPLSLKLGPFVPGMDNRRPETRMHGRAEDGGDFFRSAVNADISNQGTAKRRTGYQQVLSGTDCHSFWAGENEAFFADGTELKRLTNLEGTPVATTLRSDLTPGRAMSYAKTPLATFYSNGQVLGRLSPDSPTASPQTLSLAPALVEVSGALLAARYGFCFTRRDATGAESEATTPVYIELGATGGVRIMGLPGDAVDTVVYVTEPNGSTFLRHAVARSTQLDVTVVSANGARCPTLMLARMPAGDIVRHHFGRLLVASGPVLYYSETYMLGLFRPSRGFIQFPSTVTVVEPTSGGVWVCADQTYWLPGLDVAKADLDAKLPYGGVANSGLEVPNSNDVCWMSPRGIVRGTQTGEVTNLQEARVATPAAEFAASFFREHDGVKQIGAATFGIAPDRMAATSFMDAEVIRKKVIL